MPSDLFQVRGLVELVKFFGWNWVGTVGTPVRLIVKIVTTINSNPTNPTFNIHADTTWVFLIHQDDYSRYGIQAFSHQFRQLGGCLAYHLTIPQSPTFVEIGAMADTLQSSKAKVVVAFATEGQLLELFSEVSHPAHDPSEHKSVMIGAQQTKDAIFYIIYYCVPFPTHQLVARNVTGIQWVASEAWVTANMLTAPQFHLLLQGTLGFSFPGVYIPGLREFLLKVRPKAEPGFEFHNMLWEEVFDCRLEFTADPSNINANDFERVIEQYDQHESKLNTHL